MADLSSQDPLLNLMRMERELFMRDKAHLPTGERERQWAARTVELTSALGSATVTATGPIDPTQSINSEIHDTKHLALEQRMATVPVMATGMARCHSVNPSTLSGWPFPS
jgi:hypothetical protein